MILDLQKFLNDERPSWSELDRLLNRLENDSFRRMSLEEVRYFHHLYERASADLAKVATFAHEQDTKAYLESLVARAYGEVHEVREGQSRFNPFNWLLKTFPQTFRRHMNAFLLSLAITVLGVFFGAFANAFDSRAKDIILPQQFSPLRETPTQRVAREEKGLNDRLRGVKSTFSSYLMQNNIRVSILALALGATWGLGTFVLLFYNGVILGAICQDYIADGQGKFLAGWLLPHGVVEIPAILIGAQAGFILASAIIGWRTRDGLKLRLRKISPDIVTLICGVAVMLVWAGLIEAFMSQYHEPILPYSFKIAFGCLELFILGLFLFRSGREAPGSAEVRSH